jgi:transcriptional regulator with XRE-family HTH domain
MEKTVKDPIKKFGELVRKKRKQLKMTQLKLEKEKVISRKAISNIENGKSACTIETASLLINLFHITLEELREIFY